MTRAHPEPDGICPLCGGPSPIQSQRYPRALLCEACTSRATDLEGRPVVMFNEGMSGGFLVEHRDDGSPCGQVMREGRVLVDGTAFSAGEHRFGGIVVQAI